MRPTSAVSRATSSRGSLKEHHSKWRHVKVAITSATIDLDLFSGFFERAPVVEIPGRMFPVDVQYVNPSGQSGVVDASNVASVVAKCALMIQQAFPDPSEGDILCFLPGQDDVLRAKELFESSIAKLAKTSSASERLFLHRAVGHALYGKQDPDEQALVFKKDPMNRKVIFATDVAETSVTIDGVVFVVDSGVRKAMVYDPVRNMSSLKVHSVSRSSALQRCGRAGRTRPGKCFRLYSQQDFDEMEIGNAAEIFQQPLTLALLTLSHVGIRPREFHWIEAPNADAMARAEAELLYLGAVDERGAVTALGRLVAEVQVDPKLVRLIDRAAQQRLAQVGVDLVAVLSVANIAFHKGKKNDKASKVEADKKRDQFMIPEQGDIVSLYRTYCAWKTVLEGCDGDGSSVDDPPTPPKPDTSDAADDDDDDEDGGDGWMAAVAINLMQLKMKAVGALRNKHRRDLDGDDDGVSLLAAQANDDDDDDAMSVSSMGSMASDVSAVSEVSSTSSQSKKPKRRLNEKKARTWCMANGVNGKAMGIARATAKELLQTLSRAKSWSYGKVEGGPEASDAQLRRLVASGFFLNAAVNKPISLSTHRRGGPQYYALYSGVLGSLFMGSALHLDEKKTGRLPPWILFDSILRLNGTTFLALATPIEERWIQEESPAFYAVCTKNRAELPVDTLEYPNLSLAVLRNLFGKAFQQLNRWETQLKSTLSIDRESGTLTVFCAPIHAGQIKETLDKRLNGLQNQLAAEATEEVYMGKTRALIGRGFQVEQLLFDKDFVAMTVRNLPNLSDRELEQRLMQWTRSAGCARDVIRSADVLRGNNNNNATVSATLKFSSKEAAVKVYESMRGDSSGGSVGEALSVAPIRKMGDQSSDSSAGAEFAGRIKLTWADGDATGDAKVYFRTSFEANWFIQNSRAIFPGTSINTFAIGQTIEQTPAAPGAMNLGVIGRGGPRKPPRGGASPGKPISGAAPPPPLAPVKKEPTGVGSGFQILFDTSAIATMPLEQQARLRFGVHLKGGLPLSMDEMELMAKIRPTSPGIVYAKVTRKPITATTNTADSELEVRFRRMLPLLTCLDETTVHTDFVDQTTHRAGVVVFCRDLPRLRETYQLARDSPLWDELEKPHGQPIRMELEYSYTTVLHTDLHRCFREQIAQVLAYAQAKGVLHQESQPTTLVASAAKNMVTLKFLGELPVLERIKAKLDESMTCEKVESPDLNMLFSVAGRRKVQWWMDKHIDENGARLRYFIRWINKKNEFWVYGDAPSRAHGITKLLRLIAELKSLEVVDQVVRIVATNGPKDVGAKATKDSIRPWLAKSAEAKALYSYFVQSNRCLFVSGSTAAVAALTHALQRDGLLFEPRKRVGKYANSSSGKPDCGLCGSPVDEPAITLTLCNHAFCLECIQPMFQPATFQLPAVCPSGCGKMMHMDDVSKIVNDADSLSRLVETAVFDYVAKHKSTVFECPKPGCNQILNTAAIIGESSEAVGGRSIFCDQCHADFCIDCTEAGGRPIKRHARKTCAEFRARQVSPQVAQHLRTIQEQILNVSCPQCRAVFLDFTGCTSVQCGNTVCGHYFCANCLALSTNMYNTSRKIDTIYLFPRVYSSIYTSPANRRKHIYFCSFYAQNVNVLIDLLWVSSPVCQQRIDKIIIRGRLRASIVSTISSSSRPTGG